MNVSGVSIQEKSAEVFRSCPYETTKPNLSLFVLYRFIGSSKTCLQCQNLFKNNKTRTFERHPIALPLAARSEFHLLVFFMHQEVFDSEASGFTYGALCGHVQQRVRVVGGAQGQMTLLIAEGGASLFRQLCPARALLQLLTKVLIDTLITKNNCD